MTTNTTAVAGAKSMTDEHADTLRLFLAASLEGLDVMRALLDMDANATDAPTLDVFLDIAQGIAGQAAELGFGQLHRLATGLATFVAELRAGERTVGNDSVSIIAQAVTMLRELLLSIQQQHAREAEGASGADSAEMAAAPHASATEAVTESDALVESEPAVDTERSAPAETVQTAPPPLARQQAAVDDSDLELAATDGALQYLVFAVEHTLYAVAVSEVEEIIPWEPLQPAPGGPLWLKGILQRGGLAVPVIELRQLFGLAGRDVGPTTTVILLRHAQQSRLRLGIIVDEVADVHAVGSDAILAMPATESADVVHAMVAIGDNMAMLLNMTHLFSRHPADARYD